ncbi:MAG: hypothetical protein WDW36_006091 [Sanguina aurantia]
MFLTLYVDAVPWFVQSSFDVQFQPGSLARLATSFSRDAAVDGVDFAFITFQNSFQSLWNVWVMTRRLLMRTGLHDENVNPGWYDDTEYAFIMEHRIQPPAIIKTYTDVVAQHSFVQKSGYQSGSSHASTRLAGQLMRSMKANPHYISAKWGCDRNLTKEWYDFAWGDCKFMTPFNVTGAPVWRWRGNSTSLDPVQREYIYEGTGKGSYTGLV